MNSITLICVLSVCQRLCLCLCAYLCLCVYLCLPVRVLREFHHFKSHELAFRLTLIDTHQAYSKERDSKSESDNRHTTTSRYSGSGNADRGAREMAEQGARGARGRLVS